MERQEVGQQFVAGGNMFFGPNPSSEETLVEIAGKVRQLERSRSQELAIIEGEFGKLRDLHRRYIVPDLQDANPPDAWHSPARLGSREPAFDLIKRFFETQNLQDNGNRCLFLLGDAGMGKTSLLLMLKFRHLTALWPTGYHCELMKLGPDTVPRIEAIRKDGDPARTVLLLDSLDEDPEAHRDAEGAEKRLLDLLPRIARFHRVLITCRTQFFPEIARHFTTLPGHFVVGPYECALKYLALFDDVQVEKYLRKCFPPGPVGRALRTVIPGLRIGEAHLEKALEAARSMDSLQMRPLLLSHIHDFITEDGQERLDFRNRYVVYHRLVDRWLARDAAEKAGIPLEEGWRMAIRLALHLLRTGLTSIHRDQLSRIRGLEQVPRFQIEARSLLNRSKDPRTNEVHFRFAHATIPEFLVARAVLESDLGFDVTGTRLSRETFRFARDAARALGRESLDLRGARGDFPEFTVEYVRETFGIVLVAIGRGEFLMGSPTSEVGQADDETQHRVVLTRDFWLGQYPVTQRQYAAVMGANPSHRKGDDRPVESVNWDDAVAFCRVLSAKCRKAGVMGKTFEFRLPTEAEWEYACRAGTTSAFNDDSECTKPDGADPALNRLGWFDKNSNKQTHPVGEKMANAWGLHDMHGNVWEWCEDRGSWNGQDQRVVTTTNVANVVDPIGSEGGWRVVRGGSYWNNARFCRSACRRAGEPGSRGRFLGFRLAAGLISQEQVSGAPGPEAGGADAPVPEAPAGGTERGAGR
jgi:formylglycine-generating enzyme required for sulfatase activity